MHWKGITRIEPCKVEKSRWKDISLLWYAKSRFSAVPLANMWIKRAPVNFIHMYSHFQGSTHDSGRRVRVLFISNSMTEWPGESPCTRSSRLQDSHSFRLTAYCKRNGRENVQLKSLGNFLQCCIYSLHVYKSNWSGFATCVTLYRTVQDWYVLDSLC